MSKKEKQEKQEPKQEKKLELKDCVARESGWDFTLGILGCYAVGALALAAVFALFLVVFQMLIGAVPLTNGAIRVIVFLAFGAWLIGFTLIAMILREPLVEYWQRNVVGYTIHYFYGEDGKTIETFIHYGRIDRAGEGGTRGDIYLYVPLGGWFRQPLIKLEYNDYRSERRYWRLKMAAPYQYVREYHFLYLCDNHGGRFLASVKEILWVISQYPQGSIADVIYLLRSRLEIERFRADDMTERFNQVVYAATKATAAIAETSRLGHSKEGLNIRRCLTQAIINALPGRDKRIAPLEASLEAKVGSRKKKANAVRA